MMSDMNEPSRIDVSSMFPDYESADAVRHDGIAVVRLVKDGQQYIIRLSIEHMYSVLNRLRAEGPQTYPRKIE